MIHAPGFPSQGSGETAFQLIYIQLWYESHKTSTAVFCSLRYHVKLNSRFLQKQMNTTDVPIYRHVYLYPVQSRDRVLDTEWMVSVAADKLMISSRDMSWDDGMEARMTSALILRHTSKRLDVREPPLIQLFERLGLLLLPQTPPSPTLTQDSHTNGGSTLVTRQGSTLWTKWIIFIITNTNKKCKGT